MQINNSFAKYAVTILSMLIVGFLYQCRDEYGTVSTENLHQSCSTKADCGYGQDCRIIFGDQKTCEIYCDSDSDCPEGYHCQYCPEGQWCLWNPHACFEKAQ